MKSVDYSIQNTTDDFPHFSGISLNKPQQNFVGHPHIYSQISPHQDRKVKTTYHHQDIVSTPSPISYRPEFTTNETTIQLKRLNELSKSFPTTQQTYEYK